MDDAQRALDPRVGQFSVEVGDLRREQQALVDDGARGERRNVEEVAVLDLFAGDLVLDALANDVQLALEMIFIPAIRPPEEYLLNIGLRDAGLAPDSIAITRRVAPTENAQALFADDPLHDAFAL